MVNGVATPKLEDDWDEQDIKKIKLNAKAMNLLYCALDPTDSTESQLAPLQRRFGTLLKSHMRAQAK